MAEPSDTDFSKIQITYDKISVEVPKGTTTKTITGLTNETSYEFTIKSVDKTGNKSSGTTVKCTPTNAPIPGNSGTLTYGSVADTSLSVSWTKATDTVTAQASLIYRVYYSTSNNITTVADCEANGTAANFYTADIDSLAVTGLTISTTYYFNVVVKNTAGNKACYVSGSQATGSTADTTAPTAGNSGTLTYGSVADTSLSVSWTKATDTVTAQASLAYRVYYSTSNNITTVADCEANGTAVNSFTNDIATLSVTGLTASTTYYFNVIVKDTAGNKACYVSNSQATNAPPDTTPPTLSSVSSADTAATTAKVSATSNEAGTMYYVITASSTSPTATQVVAGQNNSGTAAITSGNSAVSAAVAKTFSVSGLSNFTKYYYYIVAVDGANNKSSVSGGSFATIGDGCTARFTFENAITDVIGTSNLPGTGTYSTTEKKEGTASLYLNGSTSFSASYTLADTESISAWVYLDASAGVYPVPITVGGIPGVQFYYYSNNLKGVMGNSGTEASGSFTTGAWHHIAVTAVKSTDTLYLYIDGTKYDGSGDGDSSTETNTLTIGDDGSGTCFWKGYIDDVQIYNRVLSDTEVSNLYNLY